MSIQDFDYLIVGGGLAAASAVDGIREVDEDGTILILADEEDPPYHRPPLSKEYMQTAEAPRDLLLIKPPGWFDDEPGVTLVRGVRGRTSSTPSLIWRSHSGHCIVRSNDPIPISRCVPHRHANSIENR